MTNIKKQGLSFTGDGSYYMSFSWTLFMETSIFDGGGSLIAPLFIYVHDHLFGKPRVVCTCICVYIPIRKSTVVLLLQNIFLPALWKTIVLSMQGFIPRGGKTTAGGICPPPAVVLPPLGIWLPKC